MAPVSKKNLIRKITARLPRRCPRQVERRIIADYSNFTKSSAFTATGQLATRAALVNANWRGWHSLTAKISVKRSGMVLFPPKDAFISIGAR